MPEKQLNVKIAEELMDRLDDALLRHSKLTKNELVEDVLATYLEYWEEMQSELQRYKKQFVKSQMQTEKMTAEKRRAG